MINIFDVPEQQAFQDEQREEFLELLRTLDQHTVRTPISSIQAVELDANCQLKESGFALAPLAAQQLCKQAAKGLWSLAADIAGVYRTARTYDSVVSVPLAARIINDCVALRFRAVDGLCGRDMIQNHMTRVVDGIVGPRYQLLPNHQLLEAVAEMMDTHDVPMQFHSGLLVGRRMAVTFLSEEPLCTTDGNPVFGGVYFSNSEAGECGVRGATILQFGRTMRCMHRLRHIAHSGKDFLTRLSGMFSGVLHSWDAITAVAAKADVVLAKKLGLLTADGQINRAKRTKLQSRITDYVDKSLAEDIVRKAIFMGAHGTYVPRTVAAAGIASRCVRDVVMTLMKTADGQYPEIREKLERAAFDILAAKVQL